MAASSRGPTPSSWGDGPSHALNPSQIDGSYTGATLPPYMDNEQNYGALLLLRISGVDRPLPNVPFIIRKSVQQYVGGRIEGAFPEANRATYALKVRSLRQFNRLLTMSQLIDGTPVHITEHPTLNSTRCVVSCRDVINVTDSELLEELKEQGIKEVRRITRSVGGERVNTPSIILTFRGTNRPDHIDFGYIRCRTRPYYPSPMQCFNCWCFGHTKLRCQSKSATCGKCSGDHPIPEDKTCPNAIFCKQCQTNDHAVSSRSCPQYKVESTIQRVKVDQGLSYPAARRMVEKDLGTKSYASTVEASNRDDLGLLNSKIDYLTTLVSNKDSEIADLRAALAERNTPSASARSQIDELKTIVANQAKQIETLTNQLSAFLSMVMPAGPSFTTTSSNTPVGIAVFPARHATEPTLPTSFVNDQPAVKTQQQIDDLPIGIISDSDSATPDHSPNLKDTPRPTRFTKSQSVPKHPRSGTPIPNSSKPSPSPNKTPNKRSINRIEPANIQQQKRVKHKSASEGSSAIAKR